jgi:hypothetical protein
MRRKLPVCYTGKVIITEHIGIWKKVKTFLRETIFPLRRTCNCKALHVSCLQTGNAMYLREDAETARSISGLKHRYCASYISLSYFTFHGLSSIKRLIDILSKPSWFRFLVVIQRCSTVCKKLLGDSTGVASPDYSKIYDGLHVSGQQQAQGRVRDCGNNGNCLRQFLISSFRRVLNVACNLLGCSPACGV